MCNTLWFSFRTSIGFNMLFLEEIWSRNFTNLFIAPMKIGEIIFCLVFTALIRALIGLIPAVLLTSPLFGISILDLGVYLFLLFLSLYIFGVTLGILVSSGLLRFGPSFENIAWSTMFLLAPFGCIYYQLKLYLNFFKKLLMGFLWFIFWGSKKHTNKSDGRHKKFIYSIRFKFIIFINFRIFVLLFFFSSRKRDL